MTIEELEELIEAGKETQNLDFKGDCLWNVHTFAKDILAMANLKDGGKLIIGIKDETFEKVGVSATNLSSYKEDEMKDKISSFADPHVDFHVEKVQDSEGKNYILIDVSEFDEIPVISRKDGSDCKAATIYYRNRNRRVESAPISNSFDLRDLIELAAIKKMRKWEGLGLSAPQANTLKKFEEERKDFE